VYDIYFSTLSNEQPQLKAKRHTGVEKFREHIEALMEHFADVCSITVTDYKGTSPRASVLNPPVIIHLLDVKSMDATPKVAVHAGTQSEPQTERQTGTDNILHGLSGLFAGTEYEGLGNAAPLAKLIDDRHVINRLQEKNEEQLHEIDELKRKNGEWQQKYETLNGNFERLQDDADDMEDELSGYRERDKNRDKWVSVLDAAGASIAKNFIRQNPKILSGIIPAEQLQGILSDDEQLPETQTSNALTAEGQEKLDDATTVFEWLQALEPSIFTKVITVIAAMRQSNEYTDRILAFLNGNKNIPVRG
jgi:hypothetical protein